MGGVNGDMKPLRPIVEVARDDGVLECSFRVCLD